MSHNTSIFSRWALALPIVVALSGCTATEADTVSDPTVTFPPSYSADPNQQPDVTVTPAPGWTISRVDYTTDGVNWQQATASTATAGAYSLNLTNLDIGPNLLTVRVTSTYRNQTQVSEFSSAIDSVKATFDCGTPGAATQPSMLPNTTLLQSDGTEERTMIGYFGDPTLHTVTFVINFTETWPTNNPYTEVASITKYGRDSITAAFPVSHATCDTCAGGGVGCANPHDCNVQYGLTVYVDGSSTQLCANTNYGVVNNYAGR